MSVDDKQIRHRSFDMSLLDASSDALRVYTERLASRNSLTACMACSCLAPSGSCTLTYLSDVESLDVLRPPVVHPGMELTGDMLLHPDSYRNGRGFLCPSCHGYIEIGETPPLALSNGLWIGSVPGALGSLTFAERLLITRSFPCSYRFTLTVPKQQGRTFATYCIDTLPPVAVRGVVFDELPLKFLTIQSLLEVRVIGKWKGSPGLLPDCMRIRRKRVETALHWLGINNPTYANVLIDGRELEYLPDDGFLSQAVMAFMGIKGPTALGEPSASNSIYGSDRLSGFEELDALHSEAPPPYPLSEFSVVAPVQLAV
jgi:hypothetical protein